MATIVEGEADLNTVTLHFDDISAAAQGRFLDSAVLRIIYGVGSMPLVSLPFIVWYVKEGHRPYGLAIWGFSYVIAFPFVRLMLHRFRKALHASPSDATVRRWLPRFHLLAAAFGFSLSIPSLLTGGTASFEFQLLYLVVVAAIVASHAVHQTQVIQVFYSFFIPSWLLTAIVFLPHAFPDHWQYIILLPIMHAHAVFKYANHTYQFLLQNVLLKEQGKQLADNYLQAKEVAEKALRDKNQFLATASHDLRQPVHAMGFLIEAISVRNRDPELIPALRDLHSSVRSVNMMFNSLLDLSKIESGTVSVTHVPIEIDPLLDEVASLFREEAGRRGLGLRVRKGVGRVVLADPVLLKQSLVNLVHNAVRYTREGGVLLSARRRGMDWLIEVWDTGIGVEQEEHTRIYSPFYRNAYAWHIDSEGHGLGLAVVARCATLMGATHGLSSRMGRGSRFWLRLPQAQTAGPAPVLPTITLPVTESPRTIGGACLVVEDDPQVASAWMSLMQAWAVHVECVDTADKAFALLDQGFMPQAVLCDQRLRSGESGFDVLKEIFRRCPDASGAMVSGEFHSPQLQQAEQEGYLVLRKPLEVDRLHGLLALWLTPSQAKVPMVRIPD